MLGHILESFSASAIKIKAFPLFSTLMAVNATFIDVCNIDIQGHEFQVVKTIPFDKVKFGILIIEFFEIPEPKEELLAFMENKGYQKIHENRLDYFFGDPEYIKKLPGWIKRNSKS